MSLVANHPDGAGVYLIDEHEGPTLVHLYQEGDYGLEDIVEFFQLGVLEPSEDEDETVLVLDASELRQLKAMAHAYSFDHEEGFIEMCLEMQQVADGVIDDSFRFASNS